MFTPHSATATNKVFFPIENHGKSPVFPYVSSPPTAWMWPPWDLLEDPEVQHPEVKVRQRTCGSSTTPKAILGQDGWKGPTHCKIVVCACIYINCTFVNINKYNIYYYKYYIIYMHTACTCTVNKIIKCIIHSDWYPRQTSKRQDDMGLQDSGLYLAASAHHLSPEKDACPPWKTCIGWAKVSSHTDPNSDTCHGSSNVMGFLRCSPFFKNSRNNYGQKTKHVSKHAKTCKNYQFLGSFLNHQKPPGEFVSWGTHMTCHRRAQESQDCCLLQG